MRNERIWRGVLRIVRSVRAVMARVTPPRGLALVPVSIRRRSGPSRWLASMRRGRWLPLLVGVALLAAVPAWAGAPALPAGVPNIYDPAVRAHFQPVPVANLQENPDLPMLLLVNDTEESPPAILLGVDARNGKDTWSLSTDPIILIVVFADAATVQDVYVDIGFVDEGKASGTYAAVDPANDTALPELLKAVPATGRRSNI
ncbi:MAG TPA: hypothetical protein VLM91_04470 [Candidatus Methylomirabilis sp.]|nr:hypothetical protein [Candidatus Methylomirabilis sp.]